MNRLPLALDVPEILSVKRRVDTHPIRTQIKVVGSTLFALNGIACSGKGFRFSSQLVKVRGAKIAKYAPDEMKVRSLPKLKSNVRVDNKRMAILPQERANRLQWQTIRPKKDGEMILAWFGPIIEDAIVKLTLNKQQGTLLIWYNSQSRRFNPKGLYLYRRLGVQENMEWRWV